MNIDNFKANVKSIARTNKYKVYIAAPSGITLPKNYQYLTKEVSYPGQDIRSTELQYWGGVRQIANNVDYDLFNITFYSDGELALRKEFIKWSTEKIFNLSTWTHGFYFEYVCTILVEMYNHKNEIIDKIKVEEAWPKNISDTTLSWENYDAPFEFTVGFQYFDWVQESF